MPHHDEEESSFPASEVERVLSDVTQGVFDKQDFSASKVPAWQSAILESALKGLQELQLNLKFCVSCLITQRCGAGLVTASAAVWQPESDGSLVHRFFNDTIECIVTVYGVAF